MIYTLIGLLLFFWVLGLVGRVGGDFVHFLLGAAVLVFLFNLVTGRRADV